MKTWLDHLIIGCIWLAVIAVYVTPVAVVMMATRWFWLRRRR
jgi:hypothetical protein